DRRTIMMLAQAVPLACSLVRWRARRSGLANLSRVYATVVAVGVAWAFDSPSRAALLPTLVAREAFPRAVTIAATNQALAFTTGPALFGWVIAAAGVGSVHAVQAGLIAASREAIALLRGGRRCPG